MAKDRLMGEVWQEYDELNERLEELSSKLQKNLDEAQLIDDDERRIFAAFDSASGEEDKTALLFEAKELQQRRKHFMEEVGRLTEKFDEYRASQGALKDRVNERLDDIRTAALETERMLFEIGKLVATLAIGTIVAMAAVTPALVPQLENLEGMWPAFRWLLISLVVSVFMCVYSMTQVSQLLARSKRQRRDWLPEWASRLLKSLPYPILFTFSVGALVSGIIEFARFISTNMS